MTCWAFAIFDVSAAIGAARISPPNARRVRSGFMFPRLSHTRVRPSCSGHAKEGRRLVRNIGDATFARTSHLSDSVFGSFWSTQYDSCVTVRILLGGPAPVEHGDGGH